MSNLEEIIVIEDDDDDDLEEGEIADDISEPEVISPKPKKLPRRYNLRHSKCSNTRFHSHRHQPKANVKLKSSNNSTDNLKKHKKSKDHLSPSNDKSARLSPPISSSSFKAAFKNYASPPRAVLNPTKFGTNSVKKSDDDDVYSKLLLDYKKTKERINQKLKKPSSSVSPNHKISNQPAFCDNKKSISKSKASSVSKSAALPMSKSNAQSISQYEAQTNIPVPECEVECIPTSGAISNCEVQPMPKTEALCSSKFETLDGLIREVNSNQATANLVEESEEDSEDEEELRRLALATFSKKCDEIPKITESNDFSNSNNTFNENKSFSIITEQPVSVCGNVCSDNYEVVDMELDNENTAENFGSEILFVIDKTPSEPVPHSASTVHSDTNLVCETHLQNLSPSFNVKDDEDELLRAELIANMKSRKTLPKFQSDEKKSFVPVAVVNAMPSNPLINTENNRHVTFSRGQINVAKFSSLKVNKTKLNYTKLAKTLKNKKCNRSLTRSINAAKNRLIITLNDSSTEESDGDESDKNSSTQENIPVSSIEALISDARQKSDIKSGDSPNHVSCLSKMQQEEYNSLKRILAEKDSYSMPNPPVIKTTAADPTNLNFLMSKIAAAKDGFKEQVTMMTNIQAELLIKKQAYMASKLKVQHLKEQLHSAETIRTKHLEAWKKCTAKLDIVKKSVSKRNTLISLLESEFKSRKLSLEQSWL